MSNYLKSILVLLAITAFSCNNKNNTPVEKFSTNDHLILSTLYQQTAAEYKALCYQAFNLAKMQLEKDLQNKKITAKRAIITDIDETMLDNSPFEAKCIIENTNYPTYWDEWVNQASAKPLPGALQFLNFAKENNVEIFYVTNRKEHLREATLKNIKSQGFPYADNEHLLMRTEESSKEERRIIVEKEYHVALLLGDNLADFSEKYDKTTMEKRNAITDSIQGQFGHYFIVLPNPMYGDWESALYNHNHKLTPKEKDSLRKSHLVSFNTK